MYKEILDKNFSIKYMIHIFYINLEKRVDRKLNIENNIKIISVNFTRINAIDGNNLDYEKLLSEKIISNFSLNDFNKKDKQLTKGEVGCYLSHIKSWETFLNTEYKFGLFLEDDIQINKLYFDKVFHNILNEIKTLDFDILFLSRNSLGNIDFYKGKNISKYFYIPQKIMYGAHSYILSQKCANKFIQYFNIINKIKEAKIIHRLDQFDLMFDYYYQIFNEKIKFVSLKPWFMFRNNENISFDLNEFIFYQSDFGDSDTRI